MCGGIWRNKDQQEEWSTPRDMDLNYLCTYSDLFPLHDNLQKSFIANDSWKDAAKTYGQIVHCEYTVDPVGFEDLVRSNSLFKAKRNLTKRFVYNTEHQAFEDGTFIEYQLQQSTCTSVDLQMEFELEEREDKKANDSDSQAETESKNIDK